MVYIYLLKHPETMEVRYVGLTRFPVKRLHNEINYPHTKHLQNWVNSLKNLSLKPVMEIVEDAEEGLACEAEQRWISEMRARGSRLINFTNGGERGYKCSDDYRSALSASMKGIKRGPMSDAHKAAIAASNRGKKRPWASENIKKAIEFNRGKPLSDSTKVKLSEFGKTALVGERLVKFIEAGKNRKRASKFTDEQKAEIKFLISDGYSHKVISDAYGLAVGTISEVKRGGMWINIVAAKSVDYPPPYKCVPLFRNDKGQYKRET